MSKIGCWIEAMRLRTLPVSLSGVALAIGFNLRNGTFDAVPAILCVTFALLAQIASNFANEYYDFKGGLDRKGREGPRRGVTEGDITPEAMKAATYGTLAAACVIGCCLIAYGGWWLIAIGIAIALGVIAYSSGPYPLSHHGLGEVAVIFFFGIIPVNLTYYVQSLSWDTDVILASVSAGLMGANVLIVNNYRDRDDDASVGKNTLAVILGRKVMSTVYLLGGLVAVAVMSPLWLDMSLWALAVPAIYLAIHIAIWRQLLIRKGAALNPLLGLTSIAMLFYCLGFTLSQ